MKPWIASYLVERRTGLSINTILYTLHIPLAFISTWDTIRNWTSIDGVSILAIIRKEKMFTVLKLHRQSFCPSEIGRIGFTKVVFL